MFVSPNRLFTVKRSIGLAAIALVSAAATAKDHTYHPPRLADGHVDLQGIWQNRNSTPLERPDQFKTLVITAEQAANYNKQLLERLTRNNSFSLLEFSDEQAEPIRGELRSSLITDPRDGRIPFAASFKAKAAASLPDNQIAALDGPEQRPPGERCLASHAIPPMVRGATHNYIQIVQTQNNVVIAAESEHAARVVRMNAAHAPAVVTSWLGDSIGWWEGDTLVVETQNFPPSAVGRLHPPSPFFLSTQTTVIEKFTRVADRAIHYEFTVDDATYYTQPWTGENQFLRTSEQMFEDACHEGNYAMRFILEAARELERQHAVK